MHFAVKFTLNFAKEYDLTSTFHVVSECQSSSFTKIAYNNAIAVIMIGFKQLQYTQDVSH